MTFPYAVIRRSRVPVVVGQWFAGKPFLAQTIGPWVFVPDDRVALRVLVHELRHVKQFYVAWGLALVAWVALRPGWWWLVATPFAHTVAYVVAGLWALAHGGHFYRANWFERDARQHAGEPV